MAVSIGAPMWPMQGPMLRPNRAIDTLEMLQQSRQLAGTNPAASTQQAYGASLADYAASLRGTTEQESANTFGARFGAGVDTLQAGLYDILAQFADLGSRPAEGEPSLLQQPTLPRDVYTRAGDQLQESSATSPELLGSLANWFRSQAEENLAEAAKVPSTYTDMYEALDKDGISGFGTWLMEEGTRQLPQLATIPAAMAFPGASPALFGLLGASSAGSQARQDWADNQDYDTPYGNVGVGALESLAERFVAPGGRLVGNAIRGKSLLPETTYKLLGGGPRQFALELTKRLSKAGVQGATEESLVAVAEHLNQTVNNGKPVDFDQLTKDVVQSAVLGAAIESPFGLASRGQYANKAEAQAAADAKARANDIIDITGNPLYNGRAFNRDVVNPEFGTPDAGFLSLFGGDNTARADTLPAPFEQLGATDAAMSAGVEAIPDYTPRAQAIQSPNIADIYSNPQTTGALTPFDYAGASDVQQQAGVVPEPTGNASVDARNQQLSTYANVDFPLEQRVRELNQQSQRAQQQSTEEQLAYVDQRQQQEMELLSRLNARLLQQRDQANRSRMPEQATAITQQLAKLAARAASVQARYDADRTRIQEEAVQRLKDAEKANAKLAQDAKTIELKSRLESNRALRESARTNFMAQQARARNALASGDFGLANQVLEETAADIEQLRGVGAPVEQVEQARRTLIGMETAYANAEAKRRSQADQSLLNQVDQALTTARTIADVRSNVLDSLEALTGMTPENQLKADALTKRALSKIETLSRQAQQRNTRQQQITNSQTPLQRDISPTAPAPATTTVETTQPQQLSLGNGSAVPVANPVALSPAQPVTDVRRLNYSSKKAVTLASVTQVVDALTNRLNVIAQTQVVEDLTQLPQNVKDIIIAELAAANKDTDLTKAAAKGIYDPTTQTVYINTKAAANLRDVISTFLHEHVTHSGLHNMYGDQAYADAMSALWESSGGSGNKELSRIASLYGIDTSTVEGQQLAVEEAVAAAAEKLGDSAALDIGQRSVWNKAKQSLSSAFKALTGLTNKTSLDTNVFEDLAKKLGSRMLDPQRTPTPTPPSSRTAPRMRVVEGSREERAMNEAANRTELAMIRTTKDIVNFVRQFNTGDRTIKEILAEGILDSNYPIQQLVNALKNVGNAVGKSIVTVSSNVYKVMEALPNQISLGMFQAQKDFVDPVYESIADYAKKYGYDNKIAIARVTDFLEATAALERNRFFRERNPDSKYDASGISDARATEILSGFDQQDMTVFSDLLARLNNGRLDMLLKSNVISPEAYNNWKSAYKFYMPMKDWEDQIDIISPSWLKSNLRKSISTATKVETLKKGVTGREGQAKDPLTVAIQQLFDAVAISQKSKAQHALIELAANSEPHTDLIRIVRNPNADTPRNQWQYRPVVDAATGKISYRGLKSDAENSANVINCLDKEGNIVQIEVKDPSVARAFKGENIYQTGPVLRMWGNLQQKISMLLTSMNPLFWPKNILRDTQSAALNIDSVARDLHRYNIPDSLEIAQLLGSHMARVFSSTGVRAALFKHYRTGSFDFKDFPQETQDLMYNLKSFQDFGGQTSFFSGSAFDAIKRDVAKQVSMRNPQKARDHATKVWNQTTDFMSSLSDSLENQTRYVVFNELTNILQKQGMPELEAHSRAANAALNLTVNFSKRGSWAPLFNSLYMFSSAAIGGNKRIIENMISRDKNGNIDPQRFLAFATMPVMAVAAQALIARSIMGDDDDGINYYDKIPRWQKNTCIIIPNPFNSKDAITIPVAPGYSVLWTMANSIVDAVSGGATAPSPGTVAADSMRSLFDNFATIGQTSEGLSMFIPSLARPLYQIWANENFTGAPIMPERINYDGTDVPSSERYWSSANDAVVAMCKAFNEWTGGSEKRSGIVDISPETLEHMQTSYLGGVGKIFFGMLGLATDVVQGKDIEAGRFPLVNAFYKQSKIGDTDAIYRTLTTKLQTGINEYKLADDPTMPVERRQELRERNADAIKMEKALKQTKQQLRELFQLKREQRNKDYDPERQRMFDEKQMAIEKAFIRKAVEAGLTID